MGWFSCFTGKPHRKRRPRGQSRRFRSRRSSAHAGLTIRTSNLGSADPLSLYGSPRSALSEVDSFHDALEEHMSASMSSVSSQGGTPGRRHSFHNDGGESEEEEGFLDKIANWWQGFRNDGGPDDNEIGPGMEHSANGGTPGNSTASSQFVQNGPLSPIRTTSSRPTSASGAVSPHNVKSGHHSHYRHTSPGASGGSARIVEADGPATAGCINLFTATQAVVAQRRFLRSIKPKAGSSFKRLSLNGSLTTAPCAWEQADPTTFLIRSKDYMKSKIKEGASGSIYSLIGVDMYSFDTKLYHIAQHVELPRPPTLGPAAQALPAGQRFPPLLIINLQLPTYAPSVFGGTDGAGHSLVYYFALPEGWEPSMVGNEAALGLAERFFNNGVEFDGQPTRDRLKLLPRIVNVEEWAEKGPLSGAEVRLLRSYNGKPLLTRPQQRFYTAPHGQYVEIDLDVHGYAYIARRAFYGYISRLAPVIFENAFVLQGNRPEELPEVVLGAVKVHQVDFTKSRPFPAQSIEERGNGSGEDGPPGSN